jgi:hypothetical protein
MDEIKKILKTLVKGQKALDDRTSNNEKMTRAVINGQSAIKDELLNKISKVGQKVDILDEKVEKVDSKLSSKIDGVEKNLAGRIDKLGKQLAYLEDDAPTRDEHDELVGRVDNLEQKVASIY